MQSANTLREERRKGLGMGCYRSVGLVFLLLLTPMTYLVSAEDVPTVTITSDWNGSSSLGNEHAYLLSFGDSSSHEYDVSVEHLRGSTDLLPSIQTTFLEGTATLTARVVLDTAVAWNDTISIEVIINSHNGVVLPSPVVVERTFTVGSWNQPICLLYTSPSPRDQRGCRFAG
mgnify:CR=1 FL=1